MAVIDFNSPINFGQTTFVETRKGLANARWTNCFLTADGSPAETRIRQMRSTISRQLSREYFFLLRSIPLHDFCPDNISPEPSGHRNLSASHAIQAVPLRHPRKGFSQHSGQSKRKSRLAHLCRFRSNIDKHSSKTVRRRRLWGRTSTSLLRFGFNHHRFMSVTFPMGKVSKTQSRSQTTHADGSERLYTLLYPHHGWQGPRCEYPGRAGLGIRFVLHHGSWLHRFYSSLFLHSKPVVLCHQSQK